MRDEGELLDKVVDSVLQKLRKTRFDVAEHPTGLDEKIKDFEKKVLLVKRKHNGKPQVVRIVGLGGMGKTTLVKELFNRESSHYHKSCFVFDVRENARKASLESLQMKLLKGLTQIDENIGSVSEGIELLKTQNKNLVEVDGWVDDIGRIKKEIRMHDHLRDLGRDLAKDPRLPRRIWRTEDFDDLLQQSSVVIEVRGISICWKANEYQSFPGCKMRNLQLLDIDSDFLTNDPLEAILNTVQSPNLVWLHWHNFLHSSPPSWIPMKKLRVLEAQVHKLETLWQEESQAPLQLRELQISSTTIRSLSDFFGNLTNLQDLNLSRCRKLQSLPYSFRNLTRLRYLDLSYCSKLTLSSEALGNICTLEHIDLTGCESIEVLPSQLVHQRSLETLNLWELKNLRELPLDTGKLRNLKNLNLWNCHRLKYLPDSLARLNGLTEFTINTCSLRQLSFIMVEGEGESICPNLQSLYITDCRALVEVGTLPNALTGLVLADCPELRKIEWQSPLSKLQMLNLSGCFKVEQLPSVETLVSLEQLDASRCVKLRSICGLAHLTKLQRLLVYGCSDLVELVGCEHLTLLKWLLVFGCPKLQLGEAVISRWIKVTWWRDYHFKWLHSAS